MCMGSFQKEIDQDGTDMGITTRDQKTRRPHQVAKEYDA